MTYSPQRKRKRNDKEAACMHSYFIDTSALFKRYVEEQGSEVVDSIFSESAEKHISTISILEAAIQSPAPPSDRQDHVLLTIHGSVDCLLA